jgi:hypothetical protein
MRTPPFLSSTLAALVVFALTAACDFPTQPSPSRPEPTRTDPGSQAPPPSAAYPDINGTYTLTLSASSNCRLELPEDFRTQTYPATIAQGGGSLVVTVHHGRFPGWDIGRFTGVFGETNDVIFQLALEDWFAGAEYQAEYHASGRMTGAIVEERLSGILDGVVVAIVPNEDGRGYGDVTCTAPDHGVTFSRRPQ